MQAMRTLEVILKVVERCNLACSYCYYFEGGDQSYKSKPPVMSLDTVSVLANFLSDGVKAAGLKSVTIAFHGGEPMMLKPRLFDQMCAQLKATVGAICPIDFSVQTNGTHVSDAWLELFAKYHVHVGVSIDGMEHEQNRHRKFHNGHGSFSTVAENYRRLREAQAKHGEVVDTISVMDARNDYRSVVSELISKLGVDHFNFLLPDCNRDDGIPNGYSARDYGRALCEIFDVWAERGDIYVREINRLLLRFQLAQEMSRTSPTPAKRKFVRNVYQIIVVRSDGELQLDDTFIPASEWRNKARTFNIRGIRLNEYLSQPIFSEITEYYDRTPDECVECVWRNICNGGDLENRFSKEKGFNNPSIYCDGLKMLYRKTALYLRRSGYPADILRARLKPRERSSVHFAM
jgi:uncharacterized protein